MAITNVGLARGWNYAQIITGHQHIDYNRVYVADSGHSILSNWGTPPSNTKGVGDLPFGSGSEYFFHTEVDTSDSTAYKVRRYRTSDLIISITATTAALGTLAAHGESPDFNSVPIQYDGDGGDQPTYEISFDNLSVVAGGYVTVKAGQNNTYLEIISAR